MNLITTLLIVAAAVGFAWLIYTVSRAAGDCFDLLDKRDALLRQMHERRMRILDKLLER